MSDETLDEAVGINLSGITLTNPLISNTLFSLGAGNLADDKPAGIFSEYVPSSSIETHYTGIIKDPSTSRWRFFSDLTDKPAETDANYSGSTLDNIEFATAYGNLSGSATTFTGSLSGDITGTQSATAVAYVGGSTSTAVHNSVLQIAAATADATPSTIVKRNLLGDASFTSLTCESITINGGSTIVDSTVSAIGDNIMLLAKDNIANTVDVGFVAKYLSSDPSPVTYYQGLVKDVSLNTWKVFSGLATNPSTTIDFGTVSLDDFECDALLSNTVITTSANATYTYSSRLLVDYNGSINSENVPMVVQSGAECFSSDMPAILYYADADLSKSSGITLRTAAGVFGTPTSVLNGQILGQLKFHGYVDSFLTTPSATILSTAINNFAGNAYGASLTMSTVGKNSTTLSARMVITSDTSNNTLIGIGTASPTYMLEVAGSLKCTYLEGATVLNHLVPDVTATHNLGAASYKWNNVYTNYISGYTVLDDILANSNGTIDIGSSTNAFANIYTGTMIIQNGGTITNSDGALMIGAGLDDSIYLRPSGVNSAVAQSVFTPGYLSLLNDCIVASISKSVSVGHADTSKATLHVYNGEKKPSILLSGVEYQDTVDTTSLSGVNLLLGISRTNNRQLLFAASDVFNGYEDIVNCIAFGLSYNTPIIKAVSIDGVEGPLEFRNAEFSTNLTMTGGDIVPQTDSTGSVGTWTKKFGNVYSVNLHGIVQTASQPNINELGNLLNLTLANHFMPYLDATYNLGSNSFSWTTAYVRSIISNNGIISTTGDIVPVAHVTYDLGEASQWFATGYIESIYGTLITPSQPNITTLAGVTSIGASSSTAITGTLATAAQANITSLGTLTGLSMGGNITMGGNILASGSRDIGASGTPFTNGYFTNNFAATRMGIGITTTNARLDIAGSTRIQTKLRLSGQEYFQDNNTSTGGVDFLLAVNRANNRQMFFAPSDFSASESTSAYCIGFYLGNTAPTIRAISTDSSTTGPLNIGCELRTNLVIPVTNNTYNLGGTSNYWSNVYATTINATNLAGTLSTAAQPSVTSLGTLSGLSISGNLGVGTASPNARVDINGSTQIQTKLRLSGQEYSESGFTDTGGIDFILGVNRSTSASVYNRQLWIGPSDLTSGQNSTVGLLNIIFNDAGIPILRSTATSNISIGSIAFGGNILASGSRDVGSSGTPFANGYFTNVVATNLTGALQTAAQTNVTSLGTLTGLSMGGNITMGGNILASGSRNIGASGTPFTNGYFTNVVATNLTGALTTAAQPGITSVGSLSSLVIGTTNVSSGELIGINGTSAQSYMSFYNNTTRQGYLGTNAGGSGMVLNADTSGGLKLLCNTTAIQLNNAGTVGIANDLTTTGSSYYKLAVADAFGISHAGTSYTELLHNTYYDTVDKKFESYKGGPASMVRMWGSSIYDAAFEVYISPETPASTSAGDATALTPLLRIDKSNITLSKPLIIANQTTDLIAPSTGGAGALPAAPAGYITVSINGVSRKIPYY